MSALPDTKTSEDQLLGMIQQASQSSSAQSEYQWIPALHELVQREIQNQVGAMSTLLEAAMKRGSHDPESGYMATTLRTLCNKSDECFKLFFEKLRNVNNNDELLICASRVIMDLNQENKRAVASIIVPVFITRNEIASSMRPMLNAIEAVADDQTRRIMASQLEPHLRSNNAISVLLATMAAKRINSVDNHSTLLTVLERSTQGWYRSYIPEIQDEICRYLQLRPDDKAVTALLTIFCNNNRVEISKAIIAISNRFVADNAIDLIENSIKEWERDPTSQSWQVAINVSQLLVGFNPEFIDIPKLLSMEKLMGYHGTNIHIRDIVLKSGKSNLKLLFGLLKSPKQEIYSFAVSCLDGLGVTIDEMSGVFDRPPMVQLVEFFFPGATPTKLWEKKDTLGSSIAKVDLQRFDFLVLNLLNCFNFVTLYVDKSGKQGIDVAALAPTGLKLILAGVTSSFPKDDLQKLEATMGSMRSVMGNLFARYQVIPILFTKTDSIHPNDMQFAREKKIIILTSNDVQELVTMSVTGRNGNDFLDFLEKKRRMIEYTTVNI